jgi:hypothetical protein
MYLIAVQDNAIEVRKLAEVPQAQAKVVAQDERLRWPDTFSQDPAFFKPDAPPALPTQLWKLRLEG